MALTLGLAVACAGTSARADDNANLKAALILNFARFADWPPGRFINDAAPVVICVDPADALAPALLALDGAAVGARHALIRRASPTNMDKVCHLSFMSNREIIGAPIAALERSGVLIVSEGETAQRSAAISLVQTGRQVRFEINEAAAKRAGVKLSSKLLRLAVDVHE